ncbi:MAG: acyltransferase family protein, partial [Pseudomonadota bacterium]|nr:acyltransferase family protein [Pseudomonadota bacterium]
GAVLLILAGPGTPTGWVLTRRPMLWIGWISYPFYLVHWPIIQIMKDAIPDAALWSRWAGFAVAIALAWAIWRFVETPIRSRAILQKPWQLLAGVGSVTAALGAVALAAFLTQGLPGRLPEPARAVLSYKYDRPSQFNHCKYWHTFEDFAPCKLGVQGATPSVIMIGDSHAQGLAAAVDSWLKEGGLAGELWYALGCIPVRESGRFCKGFPRNAIERIHADPTINHVLLVSQWRHDPNVYGGVYLTGDKADAALATALNRTLDDLAAPGRTIVLVDPMYTAPASIPERMAQNLYLGRDLPIDTPTATHARDFGGVHRAFSEAEKRPDVIRISLIEDLCKSGVCQGTLEGGPLFFDDDHIRFSATDYFAEVLAQQYAIGETAEYGY